jgi:hypothetical protein
MEAIEKQVGLTRRGNPYPLPMTQERATLEYLKYTYKKGVVITQSYLRSTIQASNGSTQVLKYGFQQSAPVNPYISTDNSLAQSDTFEVTHMVLSLFTVPATTSGGVTTPTGATWASIAQRQYYPNPSVFSGATGGTEWQNLLAIYNGYLSIKIDTTVYYQQFIMTTFMKVGITQRGVAVSTVATTGVIPFSSGDTDHVKVSVVPMFMINGSGKQDIAINLADSVILGSLDAASPTRANFIEMTMIGFLCQGGAGQKVNKI